MKLKNTHILLISLLSIFLLLSAVSAADDVDDTLLSDNSISDVTIDEINEIDDGSNDLKDANKLSQGDNTEIISDGDEGGDGEDPVVVEPAVTTIESENTTFKYGDNIKIDVTVKDNESNPINITKENLEIYKITFNGTDYNTTNITGTTSLNNESKLVLSALKVGDYILNIKFLGNETYAASETNVTLNITKTDTTINASDVKVKLGDDIIIPIKIKIESNKTLNVNASSIKVVIGEEEFNCTNQTGGKNISSGIKVLDFNKDPGNYEITIVYSGNDNCNPSNATITLTILANNTITADDTIKVNNHTQNVTIPFVITNTNITTSYDEEKEENVTNVNVTNVTVTKDDLILILKYNDGTDNITELISDYELIGEPGNYTINFVTDDTNKIANSELTVIFANATLNEANKTITLKSFIAADIIFKQVSADYQSGEFKFQIVDAYDNSPIANRNFTVSGPYFYTFSNGISMSTSKVFTTDENGYIIVKNTNMSPSGSSLDLSAFLYNFSALPAGKYNLTIKSAEDSLDLNNKTEVTVNKVKATIVASNYKAQLSNNNKYTFKLINTATGEVIKLAKLQFKIKLDGKKYTTLNATTNLSGQCSFNLNLYPNTYPVILSSIDSSVSASSVNKNITITKKPAVLTASNRTVKYNSDYTASIKVTDKKTGKALPNAIVKVRLYTTSSKYTDLAFRANKNGIVKFSAALDVGKHKMVISLSDSNYTASSITRYVTVKKTTGKFTAPKVSTYYRSGKVFTVKLTNTANKNAMFASKMNIKVYVAKNRFYNYSATTDAKGVVKFKINYNPGTYKVVISSNDKGYSAKALTSQIKVAKCPIVMTPTALSVKKGSNFKVKVTNKNNKKVLSNVNVRVKIYTGKKYKTYTIKTNSKGIASLKIGQKVGKHKIVLTPKATSLYKATKVSKTLTVKK